MERTAEEWGVEVGSLRRNHTGWQTPDPVFCARAVAIWRMREAGFGAVGGSDADLVPGNSGARAILLQLGRIIACTGSIPAPTPSNRR